MDQTILFQAVSILIEFAIVVLSVRIASAGSKPYGWLIALTFTLYVFFDLSRLGLIPFREDVTAPLFLLASISALIAVFLILREVTGTTIRAIDREWL